MVDNVQAKEAAFGPHQAKASAVNLSKLVALTFQIV